MFVSSMTLLVDASIKFILLRNIQLFGGFFGFIHRYKCGVACWDTFIMYPSRNVVCQCGFALALATFSVLHFLCLVFFILPVHFPLCEILGLILGLGAVRAHAHQGLLVARGILARMPRFG